MASRAGGAGSLKGSPVLLAAFVDVLSPSSRTAGRVADALDAWAAGALRDRDAALLLARISREHERAFRWAFSVPTHASAQSRVVPIRSAGPSPSTS